MMNVDKWWAGGGGGGRREGVPQPSFIPGEPTPMGVMRTLPDVDGGGPPNHHLPYINGYLPPARRAKRETMYHTVQQTIE